MNAIRPNQRCLIVCESAIHDHAGKECVTVRFRGPGRVTGRHGVITARDWWEINVDAPRAANGLPWVCRAAWLLPIDGNDHLRASKETLIDCERAIETMGYDGCG